MPVHYNSMGKEFTQQSKLSELSGRDKVNLLSELMDDLGITSRCLKNLTETESFLRIWREQVEIAWGGRE